MLVYDKKEMEELKVVELELLKSFIDCCNHLNLGYYLLGGSMLGAVRHKGFIPWDDDIDVAMKREDYETFLKNAQKLLPDYYFVQTRETDPEYYQNYAKLRDSRTTYIEYSVANKKINHGIFIDIFPLDYYPESFVKQRLFDIKNKCLSFRIRKEIIIPEADQHSRIAEFGAKIIGTAMSFRWAKIADALVEKDLLYKSVVQSKWLANYEGAWGKREIVPSLWYGNGVEGCFEGMRVLLPKEYDKWLTQVYGNYMELPPKEKRISHHNTIIIDANKSYLDYMAD